MVALSSFIRFHAQRRPVQVALIYAEDRITYAELMRRIETTAGWLAAQAIGPGDVVALLMKNSPAFLELSFPISPLGAVSLPINYRPAADEVGYRLGHPGARVRLGDAVLRAPDTSLRKAVPVDAAAQRNSTRLASVAPSPASMHTAHPEDLFRLMYTSGTTERPKGVM